MRTIACARGMALLLLLVPSCDSGSRDSGRGTKELPPLVFMADKDVLRTVELYLSSEAGNLIRKLSGSMVAGGNVVDFKVSPDGESVAYLADQDTDEVFELYVFDPDLGSPVKVSGPPRGSRQCGRL